MPFNAPRSFRNILFIDAEKTSPQDLGPILSQASTGSNIYVEVRAYGDWSQEETQEWADIINASSNECIIRPYQTCGIGLGRAASVSTLISDATKALQDQSVATVFIASPTCDYLAFIATAKALKTTIYIDPSTLTTSATSVSDQPVDTTADTEVVTAADIVASSENIAPASVVASFFTADVNKKEPEEKPKRTRGTRGNSRGAKIAKRQAKAASNQLVMTEIIPTVETEETPEESSDITSIAETVVVTPIDNALEPTAPKPSKKRRAKPLFKKGEKPEDPKEYIDTYMKKFGKKGVDVNKLYYNVRSHYKNFSLQDNLNTTRMHKYLENLNGVTVIKKNNNWIAYTE